MKRHLLVFLFGALTLGYAIDLWTRFHAATDEPGAVTGVIKENGSQTFPPPCPADPAWHVMISKEYGVYCANLETGEMIARLLK